MPEISRFYGIAIRMHHDEHPPPHFHTSYQGRWAVFGLHPLVLEQGSLPPRVRGLVIEWASIHRDALLRNWWRARDHLPLEPIPPLE